MPTATAIPAFAVPLLNLLRQVKGGGNKFTARCPAHDDHNPSLSVTITGDRVLLHCHTGCEPDAIVRAVGLDMTDLFADSAERERDTMPIPFTRKPSERETLTAVYQYTDLNGNVVAEKGRFELAEHTADGKPRKTFRWRQAGQERWTGGVTLSGLALWGGERIASMPMSATVYYCEGEKAVEACRAAGLLAVTHAGGAATKDFGASLEVLRGRHVALWPDNDADGRDYMATVEARLRGVAKTIRVINVTVPPKGDAVEFFRDGGTVAELESAARRLDGPAVDYLPNDGVRVIIPTAAGTITFTFNEIEKSARALDCELAVEVTIPGYPSEPYIERINILSNSARTELRRDLENIYPDGKKFGWTRFLNTAFSMARLEYVSHDRSIDLFDIEEGTADLFFHDPMLPDRAMTIFFGDGSSLKSFTAFELAYCIAHGIPFMGNRAPQVPVLIVDYEDEEKNFRRRMKRVALGHGHQDFEPRMIRYLPANGIPLADLADSIRQIVREWGIGFMIVDSIGPACGGKPEDAVVGLSYARTVKKIGITSLHIAHITKDDVKKGNTTHPFGSIFWHNEARRTWFIAREQEEESDDLDIGLFCRKANDGQKPKPLAAHVHFDGLYGAVTLTRQDIAAVPELQEKRPIKSRVWDALSHGQRRTIVDLVKELAPADADDKAEKALHKAIENALRDAKKFTIVGQWSAPGYTRPLNLWGQLSDRQEIS